MNGKKVIVVIMTLTTVVFSGLLLAQETVATMRGTTAIDATSPAPVYKPWTGKTDPIPREFADQPPLIPHKSQSFKIDLKLNKCLTCHDSEHYQAKKATKVSESHFKDRDGKQLSAVSASRYFCTQCHVEQRLAVPLVENEYKAAEVTH